MAAILSRGGGGGGGGGGGDELIKHLCYFFKLPWS